MKCIILYHKYRFYIFVDKIIKLLFISPNYNVKTVFLLMHSFYVMIITIYEFLYCRRDEFGMY